MRKEYDFSKGVRGKFYRPDIKINLPVYLDSEVLDFVQRIAKKNKTDISSIVNNLIKNDKISYWRSKMSTAKIAITIDDKLVERIDSLVEKKIYANRSRAIQEAV